MWLSNSSVGRKVVMSLTGLFLVLFVTFHVLMNATALISGDAYNAVCEFLGANWYALVGTAVLAAGFVLHIIYAFWLTIQNKKARGNDSYAVSARPKSVEWASQNMLVLGIIVICFTAIHLFHFWAKMQLVEVAGLDHDIDPANGYGLILNTFQYWWVLVIYLVGFAALWFHMTHGFWSAFQSLGTNNTTWLPRLKSVAYVWATVCCLLFAVEAVTFFCKAQCEDARNAAIATEQCESVKACCEDASKACTGDCEGCPNAAVANDTCAVAE